MMRNVKSFTTLLWFTFLFFFLFFWNFEFQLIAQSTEIEFVLIVLENQLGVFELSGVANQSVQKFLNFFIIEFFMRMFKFEQ
jgi:hypothetical protein